MDRKEEFYILFGLLLALLGAVGTWLALPQVQPQLGGWQANPLLLPLVGLAGLSLLLLYLLLREQLAARVRAMLPQYRLETRYLRAVNQYLRRTPALLVISERQETHTELDLLAAYSQLTLGPDPDQPDVPLAAPPSPPRDGGLFGLRGPKAGEARPARSGRRRLLDALLWLILQGGLLALAFLFVRSVFWTLAGEFQFSWGGILFGALLWLGLAVLLHRVALRRLGTYLDQRGACSAPAATPGAEIWQHERLLIMGDPGSGKTTLLRHIAVICANERLNVPRRTRLRAAYGWPTPPLPIYIPLRALRDAAVAHNRPLLESYAETLRDVALLGEVVRDLPPDFFQRRAEAGGCVILLDAFDELRDAEARRRLGQLVATLPPGPPTARNRIVVTSRIVGYEGQLRGRDFIHRRLAELNPTQTEAFIHARYRALAGLGVRAPGEPSGVPWDPEVRARRLIARLPDNPGLRRLGRNPFLLALIVSVHLKSPRELPRQRHALYGKAMEMLVEEWERWKDSELDLEPTTPTAELEAIQKLRLLYELAWAMYERSLTATDQRSHTVITSSAAEQVLAVALREIPALVAGRTGADLDAFTRSEAKRWLRNLGQRGGVLQELGNVEGSSEVQIQFAHQTFQEYLASQALDASAPETQQLRTARVRERWADPRWREVLLLSSSTSADASPMVRHLLAQHDHTADLLAGAVLAEQPGRLARELLDTSLARLDALALAAPDVPISTALDALNTLAETGLAPAQQTLETAARTAPHLAVRVRSIELLAGMEPNRPAPAPLTPALQALMLDILEQARDPRLRLAAGFALARHDPHYADDNGWIPALVAVPAGSFLMGSSEADKDAQGDEKPQHRRELPAYAIGTTLVTNAQWQRFMAAGGYTTRRYWSGAGWRWRTCGWEPPGDYSTPQQIAAVVLGPLFDPLVGLLLRRRAFTQPHPESWDDVAWNGANQPVTGISIYEAEAYCRWLSAASGHPFRLPSEAEWEYAARGADGRIYPWGNAWAEGRCNSKEAGIGYPTPVGSYPDGGSPCGALDMAGNAWEWCATRWHNNYPGRRAEVEDHVYNVLSWWVETRTIRGGSYYRDRTFVRGAYRNGGIARYRGNSIGLRVASHSLRIDSGS